MRYKRISKMSNKGRLIRECDRLFRQVLLKERPHKCEWCGKQSDRLQVAHILPKGSHPRLRYRRENVLLLDFPCHPERWHKDPLNANLFIEMYKGNNYIETLRQIESFMNKHDTLYLQGLIQNFKECSLC